MFHVHIYTIYLHYVTQTSLLCNPELTGKSPPGGSADSLVIHGITVTISSCVYINPGLIQHATWWQLEEKPSLYFSATFATTDYG